jgi:hypothetical protein
MTDIIEYTFCVGEPSPLLFRVKSPGKIPVKGYPDSI